MSAEAKNPLRSVSIAEQPAPIHDRPRSPGPWASGLPRHQFWMGMCLKTRLGTRLPDLPRHLSPRIHVLQQLLFPEGVHASPEPVVGIGQKPALGGQALERLLDQLHAVAPIVEDLFAKDQEPTVDAHPAGLDMADALDAPPVGNLHQVEAALRTHPDEA